VTKRQAFGYADAFDIAQERSEALAALDKAVERIMDRLTERDLSALWDSAEQRLSEDGLPVADLINTLIKARDELLGLEHDHDLTVESLVQVDAQQACRRRNKYLHPADQSNGAHCSSDSNNFALGLF